MLEKRSLMNKSYSELVELKTFQERFEYLKLPGRVGDETFGFDRFLNQTFYASREWRQARSAAIVRDNGCDLGIPDRDIWGQIYVHHINPITLQDLQEGRTIILDLENLICTSKTTHTAIHYGSFAQIPNLPPKRMKGDTTLW
jgi:hypothetical protein